MVRARSRGRFAEGGIIYGRRLVRGLRSRLLTPHERHVHGDYVRSRADHGTVVGRLKPLRVASLDGPFGGTAQPGDPIHATWNPSPGNAGETEYGTT